MRARFCGLVPHRIRERAQPADLRLLAHRDLRPPLLVGLPRDEVLRIRAAVLDELTLVEVQHARDRLVEQREVVADDEQRAAVRAQERHQPRLGVDVEVVRRLVEQHEVAAREQDARQLGAPALAAGERADREIEPVGREPEPGDDAPHLRLGRVAARRAERVLGVAERLHVARRRIGVDLGAQLLEAAHRLVEAAARQHVRQRGAVEPGAARGRILRKEADELGPQHDAGRGRVRAGEHPQQRRLARAVAPDETDLVAGVQRERRVGEREPPTHLDCEIADLEHGQL